MIIMKDQSGFTLIELILTGTILASAVVTMVSLFISVEALNHRARNLTLATQIMQQQMESYRNTGYGSLPVGSNDFSAALPSSLTAPRSGTANITEVDPAGLKQIDVTINYTESGKTKTVESSTLVAIRGIDR